MLSKTMNGLLCQNKEEKKKAEAGVDVSSERHITRADGVKLTLKTCSSSSVTSSVSKLFPLCRAMTFSTVPLSEIKQTLNVFQNTNQTSASSRSVLSHNDLFLNRVESLIVHSINTIHHLTSGKAAVLPKTSNSKMI